MNSSMTYAGRILY